MRADLALFQRKYFESRAKAQEAIASGLVRVDGRVLRKASESIGEDARIEASAAHPWVSRGGIKLAAALDAFGLDPAGLPCLDVGASTGGFTEVLLSRGAAEVIAVDVGRGQLHPKLKGNPRVKSLEETDARSLSPAQFSPPPALIVCDVSFISLKLTLPSVLALAAPRAAAIALIKPQFEAGPAYVVKGLVRDGSVRARVCGEIETLVESLSWDLLGLIPSPIRGGEGNVEYLIGARRG